MEWGCAGDQQKAGKSISFAIVVARNAIAIVIASGNATAITFASWNDVAKF
jgi:C4-dicarboxylate transporter